MVFYHGLSHGSISKGWQCGAGLLWKALHPLGLLRTACTGYWLARSSSMPARRPCQAMWRPRLGQGQTLHTGEWRFAATRCTALQLSLKCLGPCLQGQIVQSYCSEPSIAR